MGDNRAREKTTSIKTRVILGLMVLLVPLIALLLIYNFYTIALFREKTAQSNKNTLAIYTEIADDKLQLTNAQLLEIFTVNSNYYRIRNNTSDLKEHLVSDDVIQRFQSTLIGDTAADLFFLFTRNQTSVIFSDQLSVSLDFETRQQMRTSLLEYAADEDSYQPFQWGIFQFKDSYYLISILGREGIYMGAAVQLSTDIFSAGRESLFDDYKVLFTTRAGQPLTETDFVDIHELDLSPDEALYKLSGFPDRYMIMGEAMRSAPLFMVVLIDDPTFLTALNAVQLVLFASSILTVLLIPAAIWLIRKSLLQPVGQLVDTMERIRSGNLDARADDHYSLTEFKQVNDTFNQMIEEIQHLTIEVFQRQLAEQKAELQYLQFQIRPHFFLNSLKTLYGMVQNNKSREVQRLILALSNHFRYMFKDNFTMVHLRDELSYVKNYISIQQLYTEKTYSCEIDVDEQLMDLMIPPISIQTFVENAIKHAVRPDKPLEILIRTRLLSTEVGDFADITIEDNGPGFDQAMLGQLNFSDPDAFPQAHIGLANVIMRLNLIYNGKAYVAFANSSGGRGAVCEMVIPIKADGQKPPVARLEDRGQLNDRPDR